jgi:hypothetical protein
MCYNAQNNRSGASEKLLEELLKLAHHFLEKKQQKSKTAKHMETIQVHRKISLRLSVTTALNKPGTKCTRMN